MEVETSTFHLRVGGDNCHITECDSASRATYRCPPVTGTDDRGWAMECEIFLGMMLDLMALRGRSLKLT